MSSFDLVADLKGLNSALRGSLASLGGATSPEMTAMGRILRRSIATTLATAGDGVPSAPGEPPRAQTGALSRSVKAGVVGTGIRVGPLRFTADFLESGVNATRGDRKTARQQGLTRRGAGVKQRTLRIAARPYLEQALEAVKEQLATEFAEVAGARIGKR